MRAKRAALAAFCGNSAVFMGLLLRGRSCPGAGAFRRCARQTICGFSDATPVNFPGLPAAYYAFMSGQVLLVLLFVYLALFSILQRLASDALRTRTGAALSAAFLCYTRSWFIASFFH